MRSRLALVPVAVLLVAACAHSASPTPLHRDDFTGDLQQWVVEQMPGGSVRLDGGALVIEDAAGCTVWFREKLTAPVVVSWETTFVEAGGPRDRVSDLNCFWMATDPQRPDLLAPGHGRTGRFATYDSLRTYYVGYGGNTNSTTRFRRYDGSGARPLLPEHERTAPAYLLRGGVPFRIRVEAHRDGTVRYWRNDELVFEWKDDQPLTEGWFGFRTVQSHQRIRNFVVTRPAS